MLIVRVPFPCKSKSSFQGQPNSVYVTKKSRRFVYFLFVNIHLHRMICITFDSGEQDQVEIPTAYFLRFWTP